jgi:hypothetical protein
MRAMQHSKPIYHRIGSNYSLEPQDLSRLCVGDQYVAHISTMCHSFVNTLSFPPPAAEGDLEAKYSANQQTSSSSTVLAAGWQMHVWDAHVDAHVRTC